MDVSKYLSAASFWTPKHQLHPSRDLPHVPLLFWLVERIRPSVFLQLGSAPGNGYFAVCQAIQQLNLNARCLALCADEDIDPNESQQARAINERHYAEISSCDFLDHAAGLASLADQSVDLLFLACDGSSVQADELFHLCRPKLSRHAILLLHPTGSEDIGSERLRNLLDAYPVFHLPHADGLTLAAVGSEIPESLDFLFQAANQETLCAAFRAHYERLGRSLVLGQSTTQSKQDRDAPATHGPGADPLLLERYNTLTRNHEVAMEELAQIQRSLGWVLIQRARRIRSRLIREGKLSGKCWKAFSSFVRTTANAGPRVAIHKAHAKVARKLGQIRMSRAAIAVSDSTATSGDHSPQNRFEELPWRFTGKARETSQKAHFNLLLVSHSACRTGAPLCFLRLAQELGKVAGIECWIVMLKGGELAEDFAEVAPTLDVEDLVHSGIPRANIPAFLARLFHNYDGRGMAVCNTIASNAFHADLADADIPVLSWIHELPSMVNIFGGPLAAEQIKRASREIIVPADAVRDAWIDLYQVDSSRIRTARNGLDPRTKGHDAEAARSRVRKEFGLPDDALIVFGCGTVDLRKGSDLFAQTAYRVLNDPLMGDLASNTWFIWVGSSEIPFLDHWLKHDVESTGFKDRLILAGTRADTTPYFLAADLFLLTSREDPCPVANVEAMESGLPIIAFNGAGGAPEVIRDGGVIVPYLDVDLMAMETRKLLTDAPRRHKLGRIAQTFVRQELTWSRFMDQFMGILAQRFGYHPVKPLSVSVIVPNYRHAKYLEERLQSIFDQTLQPREIIFLDDASPDDSLDVARRMAAKSPVPMRIIPNETNSGSTFRQWLKGLDAASGDLIWIAESDDSCDPRFLETLVPEFYDPQVRLAYCQSSLIGSEGQLLAPDFLDHTNDLSRTRWKSRYCVEGKEDAERALSQKNPIPNASAVVFRKPSRIDFADELVSLRFTGDVLFYAMMVRGGKIAYLPDILNRYRRHESTVSHVAVRGDIYVEESLAVKHRIMAEFEVSPRAVARSLAQSVNEYRWLNDYFSLDRPPLQEHPKAIPSLAKISKLIENRLDSRSPHKILIVVEGLRNDRQTITSLKLASALAKSHQVYLCNASPLDFDDTLEARIDSRVMFLEGSLGETLWSAPESKSRRLEVLRDLAQIHGINVLSSCSPQADALVIELNKEARLPRLSKISERELAGLDVRTPSQPATRQAADRPY